MQKPKKRSKFRTRCGCLYYGALRRLMWLTRGSRFAAIRSAPLPYPYTSHQTILLRRLKDVDMQYQRNKIVNLRIAAETLNGIVIRPGETFSFWKLVGRPARAKGYIEGLVLRNGAVETGLGGGLCQLSNLIFWMALHTPLTVTERHRHGYDVFPDSNRTQPFGSGATCFYPHGDLMLRNDTDEEFQLLVHVGAEYLEGAFHVASPPESRYEIMEKEHIIRGEYWGGFSRHNKLYRRVFDGDGALLKEELVVENSALMMYSPFLAEPNRPDNHIL